MTIHRIFETDGVPAPSDFELEALDRLPSIGPIPRRPEFERAPADTPPDPHTRMSLDCFVRTRKIGADRAAFRQFVAAEGRAGAVLSAWQWTTLLELFEARDERETLMGARYAGCP